MGREIKRVPVDFDWPLRTVWKGFKNPYYQYQSECHYCDGTGYNPETKKLADAWYDFEHTGARWCDKITQDEVEALVEGGRLMDFTHFWTKEKGWQEKEPKYMPTAEEVNAWESGRGMGHDAINRFICIETRAKRLGVWGHCEHCNGDGENWDSPEHKKAAEEWEQEEPPKGEAYQIWETVSEGSPVSPPFLEPEKLAEWMDKNGQGLDSEVTYDQWLKFIRGPGWSTSMVMDGKGVRSGVAAVVDKD